MEKRARLMLVVLLGVFLFQQFALAAGDLEASVNTLKENISKLLLVLAGIAVMAAGVAFWLGRRDIMWGCIIGTAIILGADAIISFLKKSF